jgi:hypothetical protein
MIEKGDGKEGRKWEGALVEVVANDLSGALGVEHLRFQLLNPSIAFLEGNANLIGEVLNEARVGEIAHNVVDSQQGTLWEAVHRPITSIRSYNR